jgi:hypothetical protein
MLQSKIPKEDIAHHVKQTCQESHVKYLLTDIVLSFEHVLRTADIDTKQWWPKSSVVVCGS